MTTYYIQQPEIVTVSRTALAPFLALDFGIGGNTATKTVSGTVYDTNGATVSGATVQLFRQGDNFPVARLTSDGAGHYSFTRDAADTNTYFVVAFTVVGGTTQIHGVSDRGNVPA